MTLVANYFLRTIKNSCISLISILIVSSCATKKPTATDKFLEASITHESIAVLPFIMHSQSLRSDINEQVTKPVDVIYYARTGGKLDGEFMQRRTFMNLAKKVKKGKLELVIQSFIDTNQRVKEAGISSEMLSYINKGDLAKKLNVDAVLYGESIVDQGNFASDDLGGIRTHLWLYDARSHEVLWDKEIEQKFNTIDERPERAVSIIIDKLMKLLPY